MEDPFEVQFLHEVMIGERVQEALAACLRERGGSRTFDASSLGGFGAGGRSAALATAAARRRDIVAPADDSLGDATAPPSSLEVPKN